MQYPKLVESKTASNRVETIAWNPGMDLLAIVFNNDTITCSRLLSLQKVWNKQGIGRIISIAWRPDGRVLAIGASNEKTKENLCSLHDVENGKEIFSIVKSSPITTVSWFKYSTNNDETDNEDLLKSRLRPAPTKIEQSPHFSHQLAHGQTELTILMISTEDGKVSFYALGLFYLGNMTLHCDTNSETARIHMSTCLRYLTSVIYTKHANFVSPSLKVTKLDIFHDRSKEILRVAKMYAKITDELEFLDDTIKAMEASWADVLAGLDNKLSCYGSRRKPEVKGFTLVSANDLIQLLVLGVMSGNLDKFLIDMSDKGLRKLCFSIEQTCLRVQNLVMKNAQKCCYHLHNDLNTLRGMSLWKERYESIGLHDKPIVEAMKAVGSLVLKLSEMNQAIDHSLKSSKSFFRWLISMACKASGEHNISVVHNDANKMTQQDIDLITDFILENFDFGYNGLSCECGPDSEDRISNEEVGERPTCSNFTLEQVGQYLKHETLSRLKYSFSNPKTNFWIEFFQQRPELVADGQVDEDGSSIILLYPHNPDASLVQEHTRSREIIDKAFKSFAENIELVTLEKDNLIHLKDFMRNGATGSIRIETDSRSLKHYILFQILPKPVSRQYLLAQSLVDQSFVLVSIEFQAIQDFQMHGHSSTRIATRTSSSNPLLISDSCFFEDRETKKILLSFLLIEESHDSTILVQIHLDKIFESFECTERQAKDIGRVFRNNDSIDKMSSPVVLRVDLQTKPACDRKHEPEMMVKKIKGTKGLDMYASSDRGVVAFTSSNNERIHLYEFESVANGAEIMEDESDCDDGIDESLIDPELVA